MEVEAAACRFQTLSLLELLVVGAEEHWHIPDCCLKHIVDTHAKAATHIGNLTIAIDTRQQTEAVNNQHVGRLEFPTIVFCIANDLTTLKFLLYLCQMTFVDDMRSNYQFPFAIAKKLAVKEITDEDILIGRPRGACHKD